jgi:hypothetical protein
MPAPSTAGRSHVERLDIKSREAERVALRETEKIVVHEHGASSKSGERFVPKALSEKFATQPKAC